MKRKPHVFCVKKNPKNRLLLKRSKEFLSVLLLVLSSAIYAHGDLVSRIREKTIEIAKDSANSELYLDRGFLYQQHFEYVKALNDYLKSAELGYGDKLLYYRTAEVYLSLKEYSSALESIDHYIRMDSLDVKPQKLKAQILMKLNRYSEALEIYGFVINNTTDIRPEDISEYSTIFLSIDSSDYAGSIDAINFGLNKLGDHTISLRLVKIDYLKKSNQTEEVIKEYNALISENTRKEFWYYNKAVYLFEINRLSESYLACQQARLSIGKLKPKIQSTAAIKNLILQINEIENTIDYDI